MAGPLAGVIGLLTIIVGYFILKKIVDIRKRKERIKTPEICSWQYTAEEWTHYADVYNLSDSPRGAAKVRITPTDIWIDDNGNLIRLELKGYKKGVIQCSKTEKTLSIRVRGYNDYIKSGRKYYHKDFRLPIPSDKKTEADKVIEFFE